MGFHQPCPMKSETAVRHVFISVLGAGRRAAAARRSESTTRRAFSRGNGPSLVEFPQFRLGDRNRFPFGVDQGPGGFVFMGQYL